MNVPQTSIHFKDGNATLERMGHLIQQALLRRGWLIRESNPGLYLAEVQVKKHSAKVRVSYTADTYAIAYSDSSESLGYDGERIHRTYNRWVNNLRTTIDRYSSRGVSCKWNLQNIRNAQGQPFLWAGAPSSLPSARAVLLEALGQHQWKPMKDTPGMLVAEQNTRDGHSATIEISFSAQAYSIEHVKSSAGLRFDGYCIHQRYNRWIAALIESVDIYATASGSLR